MKVVICSCSHLDVRLGGFDPHNDIVRVFGQVIDETHNDVDLFIHLGDLFDTPKPSPRAYASVIELLNQLGCAAVLLEGNHDHNALEPLGKIEFPHEVWIVSGVEALGISDKKFLFVPHLTDRMAREKADMSAQDWVNVAFDSARRAHEDDVRGEWRVECVCTHLDVDGAELPTGQTMRGGDLQMPLGVARKLPVDIFVGHIHKAQTLGKNIHFPGSLVPVDFGERHDQKGYLVVEI